MISAEKVPTTPNLAELSGEELRIAAQARVAHQVQRLFKRDLSDRTGRWADFREPDYTTERAVVEFNLRGVGIGKVLAEGDFVASTDGSILLRNERPDGPTRDTFHGDSDVELDWRASGMGRWGLQPMSADLNLDDIDLDVYHEMDPADIELLAVTLEKVVHDSYIAID